MKEQNHDKELFKRYADDVYTKNDARRLLDMLKSQEGSEAFDQAAREVWQEAEAAFQGNTDNCYKEDARNLLRKIEVKRTFRIRRLLKPAIGIAASLLVALLVFHLWRIDSPQPSPLIAVSTQPGEHRTVTLPDGSTVMLNACSTLRYPAEFNGDQRLIELEGEGFFKVERNEQMPFIVDCKDIDVTVLGTQFNVKAYSSDDLISVNVESGKVQVDFTDAMTRLSANEQVVINKNSGEYSKLRKTSQKVATWRTGQLQFDHTPIHDVAKELERMYNCKITFSPGQEFDNIITGEHENTNLESVLNSIQYTSDIRYRKNGNTIEFYKE